MPTAPLTARSLNRTTLARQLLLRREPVDVLTAVRRLVAVQAQEPPSPYLALWNRVAGFDPADVDRAFADGSLVKGTSIRITLHAVAADDWPFVHDAMQPTLRAARLNDRRFASAGIPAAAADALIPELLDLLAEPRGNAEVDAWLDERIGTHPKPSVWWALRTAGPFVHAPTGGAWSFGARPSYVAARAPERPGDAAASLRRLVVRVLAGYGPASVPDVAQFLLVPRTRVREAIAALGDAVIRLVGPAGEALYDVPGGELAPEDVAAPPRLLPMWDNVLLAYADRSRLVPPPYREHVARRNGDLLPTLLVDGHVAGAWRPTDAGIEATAFHPLRDEAWAGLEAEARSLLALLDGRERRAYGRFAHWWPTLPVAERRVIA